MDGLTKLLLTKYLPNDPRLYREPLQALKETDKSESLPVHGQVAKQALKASEGFSGMVVVMSSSEHDESTIFKAVAEYNRAYPERMSYSFVLPADFNDVPKNSWVIITPKED